MKKSVKSWLHYPASSWELLLFFRVCEGGGPLGLLIQDTGLSDQTQPDRLLSPGFACCRIDGSSRVCFGGVFVVGDLPEMDHTANLVIYAVFYAIHIVDCYCQSGRRLRLFRRCIYY